MKKTKFIYNKNLPILKKGWKGNISIDGKFQNNNTPEKPPIWDVLKWKLSRNPQKTEKEKDTFKLKSTPLINFSKDTDNIIWLGHASFLITINGITLITDPCFYDIPTAKRKVKIPCQLEVLKNIDYLLISHDHRDHFDKKSVEMVIKYNPKIEILTGLNIGTLFKKFNLAHIPIQEAGWYQEFKVGNNIRIIFLPAKHWGRRNLTDFNKYLWGSFLIISDKTKLFFSGDTAYSSVFKDIQSEFGDIEICMLPIAAYAPKYIMENSHTTPEEAVQIFKDLKGRIFIPMHYGTYDLSDEPLGEPIHRLEKCFNLKDKKLKKIAVGEVFLY